MDGGRLGDIRDQTTWSPLLDYFDADVSGRHFKHGKPHPEMFLTAAHELGAAAEESIVMEDAPAGVQAAKAGRMAAIGIARAATTNCSRRPGPTSWSPR